jgi:hypothetical protein
MMSPIDIIAPHAIGCGGAFFISRSSGVGTVVRINAGFVDRRHCRKLRHLLRAAVPLGIDHIAVFFAPDLASWEQSHERHITQQNSYSQPTACGAGAS